MDKLRVVSQLWIDHLNVLRVPVDEQVAQVVEAAINVRAELAHRHALTGADFATDLVGDDQDRDI